MISVISSTFHNQYCFNLPLVVYAWNQIDVEVICFMPRPVIGSEEFAKYKLLKDWMEALELDYKIHFFGSEAQKEVTYSQVSRLYAGCLDIAGDELLITSDADMIVFQRPFHIDRFTIYGYDLTPEKQYPICYLIATANEWRDTFGLHGKSYQQCLDETVGVI